MRVRVEIASVWIQGTPGSAAETRDLARALEDRIATGLAARARETLDEDTVILAVTDAVRDGLSGGGTS